MKRTELIWRAAAILVAAFCVAAPAKPGSAEITTNAAAVRAEGARQIWAYGQGEVRFRLLEDGKLIVRHTDENRVTSSGDGTRLVDGQTLTFVGYRGDVVIRGQKIAVYYDGGQTEFEAHGDARVVFCGQGTYTLDDGDSADWEDCGTTVVMGSPEIDEDDFVWGESAQYEAQTATAAREIQTFPDYRQWAVEYPEAAMELGRTRDYYYWCSIYPAATGALYGHHNWTAWVSTHRRLRAFLEYHNVFLVWYDSHPAFRPYFHHPVFYHAFVRHYPTAFAGASVDVNIGDWRTRHPAEARTLETHVVIQNKLVLKNKTAIKGNTVNILKKQADKNESKARNDEQVRRATHEREAAAQQQQRQRQQEQDRAAKEEQKTRESAEKERTKEEKNAAKDYKAAERSEKRQEKQDKGR